MQNLLFTYETYEKPAKYTCTVGIWKAPLLIFSV